MTEDLQRRARTVYGICSGEPFKYTLHWLAADEESAQEFVAKYPDADYWVEKFSLYEWDRG